MAKVKNPGPKDEQFNVGKSKMSRAGKLNGKPNSTSGMADEQFNDGDSYNALNDDGNVNKGRKGPGGMKMQVAGKLGKAAKIMQAVATASQPAGGIAKGKGPIKPAKASAIQSKSYKNSTVDTPQPRAKSMNRGFGSK